MIIGVDTGATKTLIACFDDKGRLESSFKYETPKNKKEYLKLLKDYLESNFFDKKIDAVVIGVPSFVIDDVAIWAPNLGWTNFNLRNAIVGILNNVPIYVENDAKLAGLSSVQHLSTMPESALYVAIGTGIGTAVIENGKIDTALKHSEGGRMLIEYDGVIREWEKFASGKAIKDVYGKYAKDIKSVRTWNQIADRISRGLLVAIPLIQPDIVLFGGSIGNYYENYGNQLTKILIEKMPPHIPIPKLAKANHPEEAVVYGCYLYAKEKINHRAN